MSSEEKRKTTSRGRRATPTPCKLARVFHSRDTPLTCRLAGYKYLKPVQALPASSWWYKNTLARKSNLRTSTLSLCPTSQPTYIFDQRLVVCQDVEQPNAACNIVWYLTQSYPPWCGTAESRVTRPSGPVFCESSDAGLSSSSQITLGSSTSRNIGKCKTLLLPGYMRRPPSGSVLGSEEPSEASWNCALFRNKPPASPTPYLSLVKIEGPNANTYASLR